MHGSGGGEAALLAWLEEWRLWQRGEHPDQKHSGACSSFTAWNGGPPNPDESNPDEYMPSWPREQRTHFQMYETTSEGTPISPVMATAEELARWLADNSASTFADMTATYDQWLAMIRVGSAPSAVMDARGLISGVAAVGSR